MVYAKAPFAGPEQVIRYVSRYTHRVAISNQRILSIDDGVIRFSFKNYRKQEDRETVEELWEEMELPAEEQNGSVAVFSRRFLPQQTGRLGYAFRISPNRNEDPLTQPCYSLLKWG